MVLSCHRTRSQGVFLQPWHHEAVKLIVEVPSYPGVLKVHVVHSFCFFPLSLHRELDQLSKLSLDHSSLSALPLSGYPPSALTLLHRQSSRLGDRRQRASTVASPHIEEWEGTVDLPYPAVKCVITQVTHASPNLGCWAVLLLGAFYDANDRILWQTEVFLGDKAEDSEEPYEDSYSVSDAEECMLQEVLPYLGTDADHFQTKHLLTSLKRTITDTRTITLTAKQEAKILTSNTSVSVPEF